MKGEINFKVVEQAANKALFQTAQLLDQAFKDAISSPIWDWPNPPSPRDIVDKGDILRSQILTFDAQGNATFSWPTGHSIYVHEGYTLKSGFIAPPRRWTEVGMANVNIPQSYGKFFNQASTL